MNHTINDNYTKYLVTKNNSLYYVYQSSETSKVLSGTPTPSPILNKNSFSTGNYTRDLLIKRLILNHQWLRIKTLCGLGHWGSQNVNVITVTSVVERLVYCFYDLVIFEVPCSIPGRVKVKK